MHTNTTQPAKPEYLQQAYETGARACQMQILRGKTPICEFDAADRFGYQNGFSEHLKQQRAEFLRGYLETQR